MFILLPASIFRTPGIVTGGEAATASWNREKASPTGGWGADSKFPERVGNCKLESEGTRHSLLNTHYGGILLCVNQKSMLTTEPSGSPASRRGRNSNSCGGRSSTWFRGTYAYRLSRHRLELNRQRDVRDEFNVRSPYNTQQHSLVSSF